jgi:hypothetical protein
MFRVSIRPKQTKFIQTRSYYGHRRLFNEYLVEFVERSVECGHDLHSSALKHESCLHLEAAIVLKQCSENKSVNWNEINPEVIALIDRHRRIRLESDEIYRLYDSQLSKFIKQVKN